MKQLMLLLWMLCFTAVGCSHYDDVQKAMELKAKAEKVAADAVATAEEAKRQAAVAKDQLSAEQQAMARIYSED
jgi:hypothetical protein